MIIVKYILSIIGKLILLPTVSFAAILISLFTSLTKQIGAGYKEHTIIPHKVTEDTPLNVPVPKQTDRV